MKELLDLAYKLQSSIEELTNERDKLVEMERDVFAAFSDDDMTLQNCKITCCQLRVEIALINVNNFKL
jgi:hypothetical protein